MALDEIRVIYPILSEIEKYWIDGFVKFGDVSIENSGAVG